MTGRFNTFHRAAIVAGVVGALFLLLSAVTAAPMIAAGAGAAALIPAILGIGLKGALALGFAAVMLVAARLESRRLAMQAAAAARRAGAEPGAAEERDDLPLAA
ncbi:MAG: hypothetical protein AAGF49_13060 [Pseudomonadota bacterium]